MWLPTNAADVHAIRMEKCLDSGKDYELAITSCTHLLYGGQLAQEDYPKVYRSRGNAQYQLHQFQAAIDDFDRALAISSDDVESLVMRGWSHYAMDNNEKALGDFDQAIALSPQSALAYVGRGQVLLEEDRFSEALADFELAVRHGPKLQASYFGRGAAHSALGQMDESLADYDRAIELAPEHASAYFARALVHAHLGRDGKAIDDLSKAIEYRPDDVNAYVARAQAYQRDNSYIKAYRDLETAMQKAPENPGPYNAMAWMMATYPPREGLGFDGAVYLAEKAVKLAPIWQHADTLAAALARDERYEDAVEVQEQVIDVAKANEVPAAVIAQLQARLELYREGKFYVEEP